MMHWYSKIDFSEDGIFGELLSFFLITVTGGRPRPGGSSDRFYESPVNQAVSLSLLIGNRLGLFFCEIISMT